MTYAYNICHMSDTLLQQCERLSIIQIEFIDCSDLFYIEKYINMVYTTN